MLEIVPPCEGLWLLKIPFPRALPWAVMLLPRWGVVRMERSLLPDDPIFAAGLTPARKLSSRARGQGLRVVNDQVMPVVG